MSSSSTAVVILNYNGKKFLETFLPNVIAHSHPYTIYVADNASTDGSVEFLKAKFPTVKLILNQKNWGYAGGYNEALKNIEEDYCMLLNNDVEVTPGWLEPLIRLLDNDKQIAACQPKMLSHAMKDEFEYAGACGGFIDKYGYPFCRGRIFHHLEKDHGQYNNSKEVFWASGACLFIRNDLFKKMNGFDADFFAHMEEIDLCWRLKNAGYKIYAEPSSIIYHVGGGTLNKVSPHKTYLNFRNNLITLTKNHPKGLLWLKILFRLKLDGIAGIKFLFEGKFSHFFAVIRAHFSFYGHLNSTLNKRKGQKSQGAVLSLKHAYNGNMVLEYFLSGKKKFSELNKGFIE